MSVNLKALIGKLNPAVRGSLEAAAGLCLSRTHYDVEIEHYVIKLLDGTGTDFDLIAKHFSIDHSRLSIDLSRSLEKLKSGNAHTPALAPSLVGM